MMLRTKLRPKILNRFKTTVQLQFNIKKQWRWEIFDNFTLNEKYFNDIISIETPW